MTGANGAVAAVKTMIDVPGVKLEQVASARDETTFSVVVDGNDVGTVAFVEHYERQRKRLTDTPDTLAKGTVVKALYLQQLRESLK